ncbi:hypothetical protein VXQ18_13685 [Brucella abortus]|nr:hypothetical protein [Brucella abortus]
MVTQSLSITLILPGIMICGSIRTVFAAPLYDLLSYPDINLDRLIAIWPELASIDPRHAGSTEIEAQYAVLYGAAAE